MSAARPLPGGRPRFITSKYDTMPWVDLVGCPTTWDAQSRRIVDPGLPIEGLLVVGLLVRGGAPRSSRMFYWTRVFGPSVIGAR
jgi:hypothetical protein